LTRRDLACLIRGSSRYGQVAQLVEQRTENPRVGGSIPSLATIKISALRARDGYGPKSLCIFGVIAPKELRRNCSGSLRDEQ
jgi:hypothetical protein